MKTLFRIFVILFYLFVIIVAFSNFVLLLNNYVTTLEIQSQNTKVSIKSDSPPNTSPNLADVQEKIDFCKRENLDFITVMKYLGTVPKNYYTWNYSEDGKRREKLYYSNICSFYLQTGRYPSEQDAKKLAMWLVSPSVELKYGFISLWWLWLAALFCLLSIFRSIWNLFRQKRLKKND